MAAAFSAPAVRLGREGAVSKVSSEASVLLSSMEHTKGTGRAWSLSGQGSGGLEAPSSSTDNQDMTDEGASVLLSLAAPPFGRSCIQEWPETSKELVPGPPNTSMVPPALDTLAAECAIPQEKEELRRERSLERLQPARHQQDEKRVAHNGDLGKQQKPVEGEGRAIQREGEALAHFHQHESASVAGFESRAESLAGKGVEGQQSDCKLEKSSREGASGGVSTPSVAGGLLSQEAEEKPVAAVGNGGQRNGTSFLGKVKADKTQGSSLQGTESAHTGQHSSALKGCKRLRNTPRQQRRFEKRTFFSIFSEIPSPCPQSHSNTSTANGSGSKSAKNTGVPCEQSQGREGHKESVGRVGSKRNMQTMQEEEGGAVMKSGNGEAVEAAQVPGRGKRGGRGSRKSLSANKSAAESGFLQKDEAQSGVDGGLGLEEDVGVCEKSLRAREASFHCWLEGAPGSGASEASSQVLAGKDLPEEFSLAGGLPLLGSLAEGTERVDEAGTRSMGLPPAGSRLTDLDSVASSIADACGRVELSADNVPQGEGPVPQGKDQVRQGHLPDALNRLSQAAAVAAAVEAGSSPESEIDLFTPEPQGASPLRPCQAAAHAGRPGASDQMLSCLAMAWDEGPAKRLSHATLRDPDFKACVHPELSQTATESAAEPVGHAAGVWEKKDPSCAPVTPDLGPLHGATALIALCSTGSSSRELKGAQGPGFFGAHGAGSGPQGRLSSGCLQHAQGRAGDALLLPALEGERGGSPRSLRSPSFPMGKGRRTEGHRGTRRYTEACVRDSSGVPEASLQRTSAAGGNLVDGDLTAVVDWPTEGSEVSQDLGGQGVGDDGTPEEQEDVSNRDPHLRSSGGDAEERGDAGGVECTEQAAIMSLLSVSADPPSSYHASEATAPASLFLEPAYRPYALRGQSNQGVDLYSSRESSIVNHQEGRQDPGCLEEEPRQSVSKRSSRPHASTLPTQGPLHSPALGHEKKEKEEEGGEGEEGNREEAEGPASGEELQELYALLKGLCRTGRKSASPACAPATSAAAADSGVSASGSLTLVELEGQQHKGKGALGSLTQAEAKGRLQKRKGAGARGGKRKRGSTGKGQEGAGAATTDAAATAPDDHSAEAPPLAPPAPMPSLGTSPLAEGPLVQGKKQGGSRQVPSWGGRLPPSIEGEALLLESKVLLERSAMGTRDGGPHAETGILQPQVLEEKPEVMVFQPEEGSGRGAPDRGETCGQKAKGPHELPDREALGPTYCHETASGVGDEGGAPVQGGAQLQPQADCVVVALAADAELDGFRKEWCHQTSSDCMKHERALDSSGTPATAAEGGGATATAAEEESSRAAGAQGEGAAAAAGEAELERESEPELDLPPADVPWDLNSLQYRKRPRQTGPTQLGFPHLLPQPHPHKTLSLPSLPLSQGSCELEPSSLHSAASHLLPPESLLLLTDSPPEGEADATVASSQEGTVCLQEETQERSLSIRSGSRDPDNPNACPHCDPGTALGWTPPLPCHTLGAPGASPPSGTWPGLPFPPLYVPPGMPSPPGLPFLLGMLGSSGASFLPGSLSGACGEPQDAPCGGPVRAPSSRACSQSCDSSHGSGSALAAAQEGTCAGTGTGQPPCCAPSFAPFGPCHSSLVAPGWAPCPPGTPAVHQGWVMGALWALSAVSGGGRPFPIPMGFPTGGNGADAATGAHWGICCPSCKTVCTSNDVCWDTHMGLDRGTAQPQKATAESWEVEPLIPPPPPAEEAQAAPSDDKAGQAGTDAACPEGGNAGRWLGRVKRPRTRAARRGGEEEEEEEEEGEEEGCPCQLGGWGRVEFWWRPGSPHACPDWRTHRPSGGSPDASALSSQVTVYVRRTVWDASKGQRGKKGPLVSARAAVRALSRPSFHAPVAPPLPPAPQPSGSRSSAPGSLGQGHREQPGTKAGAQGKASDAQGKASGEQGKASGAQGKASTGISSRGAAAVKPRLETPRKGQDSAPNPRSAAAGATGRAAKNHAASAGSGNGVLQARKASAGRTGSNSASGGQERKGSGGKARG